MILPSHHCDSISSARTGQVTIDLRLAFDLLLREEGVTRIRWFQRRIHLRLNSTCITRLRSRISAYFGMWYSRGGHGKFLVQVFSEFDFAFRAAKHRRYGTNP